MERIVNAEYLYSNIKELLEAQRDVEDVRKQLGIIHLRILQRDVLIRTEETIQTMVETEAQKEFMRYAFLKEPKTPIGKLVAGAWWKFKEWWDIHKSKAVEEKTRESVLGRLSELKKETAEQQRNPVVPKKQRGTELE